MATYTQIGCGYQTVNQFLNCGGSSAVNSDGNCETTASTPAPLVHSHESTGGSASSSVSSSSSADTNSGTLTPDPTSQTSSTGPSNLVTNPTQNDPFSLADEKSKLNPQRCCESGRHELVDPLVGCNCQYEPPRLTFSGYSHLQTTPSAGLYPSPYHQNDQKSYSGSAVECSPFYSSLNTPYSLKDGSANPDVTWRTTCLQPSSGYYTYDPTFGAYGYGASFDLAARRKNATRESTATLKAWLNEHKKNPYPTKGEKIMLAIITKMTLTQVSTWFANARRRLKKENKMTWEPKNRTEDDDDDDVLTANDDKTMEDSSISATTATLGGGTAVGSATSLSISATASGTTPSSLKQRTTSIEGKEQHDIGMNLASSTFDRNAGVPINPSASSSIGSNCGVGGVTGANTSPIGSQNLNAGIGVTSPQSNDPYLLHSYQSLPYSPNIYFNTSHQHQQVYHLQQPPHQYQQQNYQTPISLLSSPQHFGENITLLPQQHQHHLQSQHLQVQRLERL